MGMLTGKEILLLDLYSFQRWPDVRAAFDRFGSYTPSWSAARRQAIADDGDTDWWNAISSAYRWMMGEMEQKGMPCPNPDAAPLWAWDFDQYHCVINRWPCAPLDAGTWPPDEYDRWLDEHWDDPAEKKRLQYRENAIVDPKRLPDRWIQACLWTITPHDVADIRPACGKPDTIGDHG